VHEVQIQVLCLQVLDGLLTSISDTPMVGVVQLAGDPNILPGHFALLEDVGKALANHVLVAICRRTIDVPLMHNILVSRLGNMTRLQNRSCKLLTNQTYRKG